MGSVFHYGHSHRKFENFIVTGGTVNCHNDDLWCHKWRKICPLVAPWIVIMTTCGATSDEIFVKLTIFCFQCTIYCWISVIHVKMDIDGIIMYIHYVMDINNSVMDNHDWNMDIHKINMDIHNCETISKILLVGPAWAQRYHALWIIKTYFMDVHNCVMEIHNYIRFDVLAYTRLFHFISQHVSFHFNYKFLLHFKFCWVRKALGQSCWGHLRFCVLFLFS